MTTDSERFSSVGRPRQSGRFRYGLPRRRGAARVQPFPSAWFDASEGRALRADEVDALVGREERWVVRYVDGWVETFAAVARRDGWLSGRDGEIMRLRAAGEDVGGVYPKSTSLRAIKCDVPTRREVAAFVGPEGEAPDVVRVKYVSGGVETLVKHAFIADEIEDAWEALGARLCGGDIVSGHLYGFGAMPHVEAERKARGEPDPWDLTREDLYRAGSLSFRASVAVLRQLGALYPVARDVWTGAAAEVGAEVLVQKNGGPWVVVDGRGRPAAGRPCR